MKQSIKKKLMFIVALLLFLGFGYTYVYDPFASGNKGPLSISSPSYKSSGIVKINSETILQSIDQGDLSVFLPDVRALEDAYQDPIRFAKPTGWTLSDSLTILKLLNNSLWGDNLDDWALYGMRLNVNCGDNFPGLAASDFQYFRTVTRKGKVIDIWREFLIEPESGWIAWATDAEYPHPVFGRKSIDLKTLRIQAEDAFRIAEENGGKAVRLQVQNQCSIYLWLSPAGHQGWWVQYNAADFEIFIDEYTGEVIKRK